MTEWLALGISSGVVGGVYAYYKHYRAQKRLTAGCLRAAEVEKRVVNEGLDELIGVKEKAMMLVGSFGGADRSYSGDTLEMAQKVEGVMDDNFRRSAELVEKLEEVEGIIAKDRDKALSKDDFHKVKWVAEHDTQRYGFFKKLSEAGVRDRAELKGDLSYLECVLETLWGELDEQDERFKTILQRQIELGRKSKFGRFQLESFRRSWARETEVLLDNAFLISKSDPVRVDQSLLVHMKKRFDKAEAALDVAERLLRVENGDVVDLREKMDAEGLEELWVEEQLEGMDAGLRELVGYSDTSEEIGRQIGVEEFMKRLYEMDFLLKNYESRHRHLGEKFDRSLEKVRTQIAEYLGVDKAGVLKDSEELKHCRMEASEVLLDLGESIANGNVERARSLNDLLKDKLAVAHDALALARRSAIDGGERVKNLRAGLVRVGEALAIAMVKHRALLASVSDDVFDEGYLEAVESGELQIKVLGAQLDLIERCRSGGNFIATEKIMNSAEATLEDLGRIPELVADSEGEVGRLESGVVELLGEIDSSFGEILLKKERSYLCVDTRGMIESLQESRIRLLKANMVLGKDRDVLEIKQGCQLLVDMLDMVEMGIESDAEMFDILNQKVEQIDALVDEARANANTAATDGIPDSELTTQVLEKVEFLTGRWPGLRSRLEKHQLEWREVRFDFDVFLQGLEAVNLQLEDELKHAKQTLDTLDKASVALRKLSAWQGERGFRAETRVANQVLHQAFMKLSEGDYNTAIKLAQQTRDEMRDSLHRARAKERAAELRNASIQSRVMGGERAKVNQFIESHSRSAGGSVDF